MWTILLVHTWCRAGGQQPGLKVGRGARAYLREDEKADVVVMLGYALTSEGKPTPTLWERVAAGFHLFHKVR